MKKCSRLHLVFVSIAVLNLLIINCVSSQSIIESLPGYNGTLPFKLETGYIGVGENEEVQLFYYFIESESDPLEDPLLLWFTGGPGCSGFSGLVYEIGPLAFDFAAFDGNLPPFTLNPYSWTKLANIIFIDSPAGTGFSYATTPEAYASSDTKASKDGYLFLRKWLLNHPKFANNPLYVAGDSYGGKNVPMVALEIAKGNEAGLEPQISLKGYIIGNPSTDGNKDLNERIPYAHRMALISDEIFELAKSSCHGEYSNPDPNNVACILALKLAKECTERINNGHILEPRCNYISSKRNDFQFGVQLQPFLEDDAVDLIFLSKQEKFLCRVQTYLIATVWANQETVQEALQIRNGTISDWIRCNKSLSYENDVESVLKYHLLLSEKGYQALAYSGDHDLTIPYMGTLKWIKSLNLTVDEEWRPWTVDGQVAGYTLKYKNKLAYFTFATVKGAGHTAPEYNPKQCFAMIQRWLSIYPL